MEPTAPEAAVEPDVATAEPAAPEPHPLDLPRWPRFVPLERRVNVWDRAELALFALIVLLSIFTPAFDAAGEPNAPFKATVNAGTDGGICLLQRKTGIECGGCGLTRGFVQLGHGNLWRAMLLNPLTPIIFLWVFTRLVNSVGINVSGRRFDPGFTRAWSWRLYVGFFVVFGLLFAWRVASGLLDLPPLFAD